MSLTSFLLAVIFIIRLFSTSAFRIPLVNENNEQVLLKQIELLFIYQSLELKQLAGSLPQFILQLTKSIRHLQKHLLNCYYFKCHDFTKQTKPCTQGKSRSNHCNKM